MLDHHILQLHLLDEIIRQVALAQVAIVVDLFVEGFAVLSEGNDLAVDARYDVVRTSGKEIGKVQDDERCDHEPQRPGQTADVAAHLVEHRNTPKQWGTVRGRVELGAAGARTGKSRSSRTRRRRRRKDNSSEPALHRSNSPK